jgi:hypothetical protein
VPRSSDENQSSILYRILRKVPGFGGYAEHGKRQTSDRQTREALVKELEKSKRAIDRYATTLVDAGHIDQAANCQTARDAVDRMIQHLESRTLGCSGFFGQARLDADRLEDVYDCDANLLDEVELLTQATAKLSSSGPGSQSNFDTVREHIDSVSQMIEKRERLLEECSK